ncbi:rhamnogalacturonan lyase [Bacillus haynesii]|uniref:rhamnogalacturonan lyase n=1 Tax=Bacillus haynesii TaxID=1925021 RepID=UPI002DBD4CFC|nr:rhamnogalacturonan lyase [Bacillus haynesii]MEC0672029.1 rhamnogalacturonan lyase [Bacillus haynesii]MEC1419138.1 rhamnogalacturonan lyase [Bacillus haynesii]MEC1474306.1 rhamnogalacturonan lyase [Bacillus haynesii]MEC1485721.1 rhamnogalacturonan lyase [Bacillus haynesii]
MGEKDIHAAAERVRPVKTAAKPRQMEHLNRGLVAVKTKKGVFLSWRLLGTDPEETAFNLYRNGHRINPTPISSSTNFLDKHGNGKSVYYVTKVLGDKEVETSPKTAVWQKPYLDVPLNKPDGGTTPDGVLYTYSANDASIGDLDGDGEYEIVLKWDPSNSKDNAHNGYTGEVIIDAYKLDGTLMWRIQLGKNIRAGAHYTQLMVYDLDGDGKAEIAMKTADGTVDGTGRVIGDQAADYRNEDGRILDGPEYLSIFHGETGRELATVDYDPPRGRLEDWGDGYGNRMDRFLAGIAYLDGEMPSLVMARGYYTRTVLVAYNFRDGKLTKLWTFDSDKPGNEGYAGQGNHSLSVADVDDDGKDEIVYGAMAVDHDGTGLYTTGLGHGDAMHVSDLDPDRPGLEVFQVHEDPRLPYGLSFRDAGTGEILWGVPADTDVGRGMAAHIDPRYQGALVWAIDPPGNEGKSYGLYTSKGEKLSDAAPASANFAIWWDGDLLRELLDHDWKEPAGIPKIDKWDYHSGRLVNLLTADGTLSNNWTKGTPVLQANLFGDWREDVVFRTVRSDALRIYTTTELTEHRFYTFMHDPVYRLGVAWQNVAYNQPPHPGFYLGTGMKKPPRPNIYTVPCKRNEE